MKRVSLSLVGSLFCAAGFLSVAQAGPINHPSGTNIVYGDVSNGRHVMSIANNPAAGATRYKLGEGDYTLGIFPSLGVSYEVGDADNLFTEIDNTSDKFDENQFDNILNVTQDSAGVNAAFASIDSTVDDVNSLLRVLEQDGYAKFSSSIHAPVMPVLITSDLLGGSLVFDFSASLMARIGVFQKQVNIGDLQANITTAISTPNTPVESGDLSITYDDSAQSVSVDADNESTAILKAAYPTEISLAYSRPVMPLGNGKLFAGVRGKYYQVELLQVAEKFVGTVDSEDLFDDVTEEDRTSDSGIGLDIGAIWMTPDYHLGATLTNLNEPSFEYNKLNLSSYSTAMRNRLNDNGKYVMESQLKVEGTYYFLEKQLLLSAAVDINGAQDPLGDEYKWMVFSAAYEPDFWLIPSVRGGLRKNGGDSDITYYTFGFSLLKVNIDLAMSTDDVEDDGDSVPRGFMANIGISVNY